MVVLFLLYSGVTTTKLLCPYVSRFKPGPENNLRAWRWYAGLRGGGHSFFLQPIKDIYKFMGGGGVLTILDFQIIRSIHCPRIYLI